MFENDYASRRSTVRRWLSNSPWEIKDAKCFYNNAGPSDFSLNYRRRLPNEVVGAEAEDGEVREEEVFRGDKGDLGAEEFMAGRVEVCSAGELEAERGVQVEQSRDLPHYKIMVFRGTSTTFIMVLRSAIVPVTITATGITATGMVTGRDRGAIIPGAGDGMVAGAWAWAGDSVSDLAPVWRWVWV